MGCRSAKFEIFQLSGSNFTEVDIRRQKHHYDAIMTSFHNIWFSELDILYISYQHNKFHWPRLSASGSIFTRGGVGKHPSDLHALKKPSPYKVKAKGTCFLQGMTPGESVYLV